MNDNELKRLRELATHIKVAITESTRIVAETKDERINAIVATSLSDLRRAWMILDEQLRKDNSQSAH